MRKIDESIKQIIISVLNCQETDAIYIFGSYGTKYFTEESDIDIAWFTNSHIDLVTRGKFERFLEYVLKMPVDLVVVNKDSSPYLLCNIFEFGEIIFEYGENFSNWFDKFYDETLIDRELYFLYMDMPVDLVVVNRDSSPYLLCNIFEFGEIIFEYGENFSNWFDKFYDETLIDRELYFLYMEEKNRYAQY